MIKGESSCTVYKANKGGFDRYFIPVCHWQENKASNVIKSGLQSADTVTVYVMEDDVTNADCIPKTTSKDMIVKGECDFVFDNTSSATISNSMKEFRLQYQFYTVSSVDNKLYGSKSLRHIKISAK